MRHNGLNRKGVVALNELKLGMIGLDTSHAVTFTRLLNDASEMHHVPGGKVTVAWPGGSSDFAKSYTRVNEFTDILKSQFGVRILKSPEEVAASSDAILLTAVDGRTHPEWFRRIAGFGKPVFIDKPFAVSVKDAEEIARIGRNNRVPLMSSSPRRFSQALIETLANGDKGAVNGADAFGPLRIEPTQGGLFWYGIHTVETLYAILGRGCVSVTAIASPNHETVVGVWKDGRIGVFRGDLGENTQHGAFVHRERGTDFADMRPVPVPHYRNLLRAVLDMFRTGNPSIDIRDTLEIVRFIEAANESRGTGKTMYLQRS